jgi:D-sedoheptulose 7-phosphate isomerase
MNPLRKNLEESITIRQEMLDDHAFQMAFERVLDLVEQAFRDDHKLLLCGNGGSAADAQHIAAELSGRFKKDRSPLFAEALHVNSSFLTAVANDYGYDEVYARMTEAMGRSGDVLIGISTSGNSENVLRAMRVARNKGMRTIALVGAKAGRIGEEADHVLHVPSEDTARIQEVHITIGHSLCESLEERLF